VKFEYVPKRSPSSLEKRSPSLSPKPDYQGLDVSPENDPSKEKQKEIENGRKEEKGAEGRKKEDKTNLIPRALFRDRSNPS